MAPTPRQAAAAKAERAAARRQRQLAALPPLPPITDTASFLEALPRRITRHARIRAALDMLKQEGFQLYHEMGDSALAGIVRSASDPDLTYACRIGADGSLSCATHNMYVCGGLRGEACKHLLLLVIGLVQARAVDPQRVDGWLAAAVGKKPEFDKERLADVFLRFSSAQAGELDWRPTATIPEDFHAW
jgi:hypothetical protein